MEKEAPCVLSEAQRPNVFCSLCIPGSYSQLWVGLALESLRRVPHLEASVEAENGHCDRSAMGPRLHAWDSVFRATLSPVKDYSPLKSG